MNIYGQRKDVSPILLDQMIIEYHSIPRTISFSSKMYVHMWMSKGIFGRIVSKMFSSYHYVMESWGFLTVIVLLICNLKISDNRINCMAFVKGKRQLLLFFFNT